MIPPLTRRHHSPTPAQLPTLLDNTRGKESLLGYTHLCLLRSSASALDLWKLCSCLPLERLLWDHKRVDAGSFRSCNRRVILRHRATTASKSTLPGPVGPSRLLRELVVTHAPARGIEMSAKQSLSGCPLSGRHRANEGVRVHACPPQSPFRGRPDDVWTERSKPTFRPRFQRAAEWEWCSGRRPSSAAPTRSRSARPRARTVLVESAPTLVSPARRYSIDEPSPDLTEGNRRGEPLAPRPVHLCWSRRTGSEQLSRAQDRICRSIRRTRSLTSSGTRLTAVNTMVGEVRKLGRTTSLFCRPFRHEHTVRVDPIRVLTAGVIAGVVSSSVSPLDLRSSN